MHYDHPGVIFGFELGRYRENLVEDVEGFAGRRYAASVNYLIVLRIVG